MHSRANEYGGVNWNAATKPIASKGEKTLGGNITTKTIPNADSQLEWRIKNSLGHPGRDGTPLRAPGTDALLMVAVAE